MDNKNTYKGIFFIKSIDELEQYSDLITDKKILSIILPESGSMMFELEGKKYEIRQNDVLFCIPLLLTDRYMRTDDFKAHGLMLDLDYHREIFRQMFYYEQDWWKRILYIRKHPVMHFSPEIFEIEHHVEAIVSHITHWMQSRDSPQMLQSLLQIFVCMLMARIDKLMEEDDNTPNIAEENAERMSRADLIFKDFLMLLNMKPPRPRYCSWYAEQLCISEKHLSAICKRVSGKTATQWINEMVTDDIRYLLLHSDLSIKEIAAQLEFPNLSFFGKYTKQHLGCNPKKFREKGKE